VSENEKDLLMFMLCDFEYAIGALDNAYGKACKLGIRETQTAIHSVRIDLRKSVRKIECFLEDEEGGAR